MILTASHELILGWEKLFKEPEQLMAAVNGS